MHYQIDRLRWDELRWKSLPLIPQPSQEDQAPILPRVLLQDQLQALPPEAHGRPARPHQDQGPRQGWQSGPAAGEDRQGHQRGRQDVQVRGV